MLSIIIFVLIVSSITIHNIQTQIENNGGVRSIIVDTGKEIKSIVDDINK